MGKQSRFLAAIFLVLFGAASASACPLCESETGERVRAGIFNADFGRNLAVTLLPFPLFLGIVALIHSGPPWARDGSGQSTPHGTGDTKHPRSRHERT